MLIFLLITSALASIWTVRTPANVTEYAERFHLKHLRSILGFEVFESTARTRSIPDGAHEDIKRTHTKRYYQRGVSDPLYASQWHLRTVGGEGSASGIAVGIVDDGVQGNHPDLSANYAADLSWNYNDNNANAYPSLHDGHGTSAAGVCCAGKNHVCGRGVAHDARIASIKLLGAGVYDYQEAQALMHKNLPIYSNSWGPADDGMRLVGPGPITSAALSRSNAVIVWANGNGRREGDRSDYDGYASSPHVIAIGAVDHTGKQADYSESGASLFAVAPSSGAGRGITTTDLMGRYGYDWGECTSQFGGTSSAAPLAAGIFARMLKERPELTSRDVQHIIAKTSASGHSHNLGFGVLNIDKLLPLIHTHTLVPQPIRQLTSPVTRVDRSIPCEIVLPKLPEMIFIERVLVTVSMTHGRRGQVAIELHHSVTDGVSVLAMHRGDLHRGSSTWTYASVHHWGEQNTNNSVWTLRVMDTVADGYVGTVDSVKFAVWGI